MTMKWIPGLAATGLLAVAGCMHSGSETKSDTTAAQSAASQEFQKAADAQKALAEAQSKAQGQRLKAQQAQSNAKELARRASQEGMQQQQQRDEWRKEQKISGKVVEASGNNLRVRSTSEGDINLSLNDSTALQVDGTPGKTDEIHPGDEVRASYHLVDGKATAVRVDVTPQQ